MCIGIGIIVAVPDDGSPIQIFGKNGNSSHDTILHEMVPVELHNRVAKIEYTYPHALRLDAPDEVCRRIALDLGVAEEGPYGPRLKPSVIVAIHKWIREAGIEFSAQTLQYATLLHADLEGADLTEANLVGASLVGANLTWANLAGANLANANLRGAILEDTDLRRANLRRADLTCAFLEDADLRRSVLEDADLRGANLTGANLRGADLTNANLEDFAP